MAKQLVENEVFALLGKGRSCQLVNGWSLGFVPLFPQNGGDTNKLLHENPQHKAEQNTNKYRVFLLGRLPSLRPPFPIVFCKEKLIAENQAKGDSQMIR